MDFIKKGLDFVKAHKGLKYCAVAVVVGAVSIGGYYLLPLDQASEEITSMASAGKEVEPIIYEYYQVSVADTVIGYVPDEASATILYNKAYSQVVAEIGYDPNVELAVTTIAMSSQEDLTTLETEMATTLFETIYDSLDEIKVKAYVMKIGDDFVVSVDSEEALTQVLENAQSLYVDDDSGISVSLKTDEHNSMVMVPEVTILQKELPQERVFVTADMMNAPKADDEEVTGDGSDAPMEDMDAHEREFVESVVKEVTLEQTIVIVEAFVLEDEIKTIDEATELITKENEKEKTYLVKKGDCPSIIAVENGMATRDLYGMNPGLEENASKMQIGDEIIVMVPEPELFVSTVEDVIYTEVIDRATTYVNNPDEYVGTDSVLEEGHDGVLEVRATLSKINGREQERSINEETVLLEPQAEKVFRGIKPLPVTTATGTFDMPLTSYYFSSSYGQRWGRMHTGIDLAAPTGTNVLAADGGIVIKAGWHGALGYMIEIDHGKGLTSVYGHNSKLYVSIGEEVAKYQTIAAVGSTGNSTGPHVHFEIRVNGKHRNPMNYLK